MSHEVALPLHGFVLAGGKSSRMGQDKALLQFRGRPMVEIAVAKLRSFCAAVAIAGNRDDLGELAPVVHESRLETGPGAGLEAGMRACRQPWALFVPVDVPMAPERLLRRWAAWVLAPEQGEVRLSFLRAGGVKQPTFCMLRRDCLPALAAALDRGERKLGLVFEQTVATAGSGALRVADAEWFAPGGEPSHEALELAFTNVNTPGDLAALEAAVSQRALPE